MQYYHRCFLVAEGPENGYPSYNHNRISIVSHDPAICDFKNTFTCSPLFSIYTNGVSQLPDLKGKTTMTFLMVPNTYPTFSEIVNRFKPREKIWFTLGLANLIIFDHPEGESLAAKVIDFLKEKNNVTAAERWQLNNCRIYDHEIILQPKTSDVIQSELRISDKLPLHLKFAVSEFIISVDKFLTASRRFTPHYFEAHKRTVDVSSKRLVNDISFLYGDESFSPSASVIKALKKETAEEVLSSINDLELREKKEEIINDRHGRIIQFNSSLSYLYSQAYSGIFPLFDQVGLVRRHSLLGIGSAISALFELVSQTEEAFSVLPFDDFSKTGYDSRFIKREYLQIFSDPSKHKSSLFADDHVQRDVISRTSQLSKDKFIKPDGFYNRLSFYSGRLGFREYDFSATAAIQVLVESSSLEWHIINYTHEIIHNHVRIILNHNLVNVPHSLRKSDYINWLEIVLNHLEDIQHNRLKNDLTYREFFSYVLINFCINSRYFGSLSKESDGDMVIQSRTEYVQPTALQLKDLIKHSYKDINEIFVHVIDFAYIYKRDLNAYVLSIWASWSTVPSVTTDLKQYICRTLIIIGLTKSGKSLERFMQAKSSFQSLIPQLSKRNNTFVFGQILELLESDSSDLLYRFSNCIIVGDIAYNFFVGEIELLLENNDENILGKSGTEPKEEDDERQIYDLEKNEFRQIEIKSKVVFLLDQLMREVKSNEKPSSDEELERLSSWLLLSLSSHNK